MPPEVTIQNENNVKKCRAKSPKKIQWKTMKGICKNIIDKSVDENILMADIKEKNMNMSLTLDQTKVFRAALIVYILEE